jgi:hypothetical protein
LCFLVLFVEVGVVEDGVVAAGAEVDFEEELLPPPHPATARVLASTASSVSIADSDVRFIGRAPIVSRVLGRPPYQGFLRAG